MSQSSEELEWLRLIAVSNRTNVSLVRSLDCQFSYDILMPVGDACYIDLSDEASMKRVEKTGRYAFSGDREYSHESISGSRDGLLFVRNGSKVWTRSRMPQGAPGLVAIGTVSNKALRPGTPSPFKHADNGMSERLDSPDPESEGRVLSAEVVDVDGESLIRVVISRPMPHGEDGTAEHTLWYASDSGCTLRRWSVVLSRTPGPGNGGVLHASGEVTWRQFDTDDNVVSFPLKVQSRETLDGRLFRVNTYVVDPESVRINSSVPDELFNVEIRDDDQVVDLDARIQLRGAGQAGRDLLFAGSPDTQRIDTSEAKDSRARSDVAISPDAITIELSDHELKTSTGNSRNTIIVVDRWTRRLEVSGIETSPHLITSFYDVVYRCPNGSETHICRFETLLRPPLSAGPFREWLKFATNHPDYPSVEVVISGSVLRSLSG